MTAAAAAAAAATVYSSGLSATGHTHAHT